MHAIIHVNRRFWNSLSDVMYILSLQTLCKHARSDTVCSMAVKIYSSTAHKELKHSRLTKLNPKTISIEQTMQKYHIRHNLANRIFVLITIQIWGYVLFSYFHYIIPALYIISITGRSLVPHAALDMVTIPEPPLPVFPPIWIWHLEVFQLNQSVSKSA